MKINHFLRVFVVVLFLAFDGTVHGDVKLPAIISDHMVLQQDRNIPIWGWAEPGEQVTVSIGGVSQSTKTSPDGKWKVQLGKISPADSLTLSVKGKNSLTIKDVLVGEVWLCSGQSNMAMTVSGCKDFDKEKSNANHSRLRMFTVARNSQPEPQDQCEGKWEVCTPETVGRFSATAYFFGRDLEQTLHVPLGLINSSWGGTAIEAWTSHEAQSPLAEYKTISERWVQLVAQPWDPVKARANYDKQLAAWKTAVEKSKTDNKKAPRKPQPPIEPRLNQNYPANLYNGMIQPLIPYAMRGAIWYQGESNAGKTYASLYGLQLETMIKDWRGRWGYDFPFAWVQLPDYRSPQKQLVEESGWSIVREQMLKSLKIPHTGMAVTLGLGEANDIHPKDKQGVGKRLAYWALADVYKQKGISACGPLYTGYEVRGNEVIVAFKHTDGGLNAKDGKLSGFVIAGEDKKWVHATAKIVGDKVVVSSTEVTKPTAVRYAWADNPIFSLVNGANLPASPFRTDESVR